ncbi:MAG: glycosyltransferase family 2 protein [Candidatus Omnitrophota bacterium]|jgi:glycosyltransferase involved in cell wall biosynthesis
MNKLSLSVIILTHQEEKNLQDCLESIQGWVENIFIVDAYSTDKTLEIARRYTDKIHQHPWENYAKQFNWALENLPLNTEWVMRLDADERLTAGLKDELISSLNNLAPEISGLYVKRRVYFLGKWMRHGGYYPAWLLRLWRKDKGYCEKRYMDEHIKLREGRPGFLRNDIIDENRKNLYFWIDKHNRYATREAIDILNSEYHFLPFDTLEEKLQGTQEARKRWLKTKIYLKSPLFIRAFLYFIYRYFIKLGFLDGPQGLTWHFLQGFWYRFLVDAKLYEIYTKAGKDKAAVREFIREEYGVNLDEAG